jgi:hypothetical protein
MTPSTGASRGAGRYGQRGCRLAVAVSLSMGMALRVMRLSSRSRSEGALLGGSARLAALGVPRKSKRAIPTSVICPPAEGFAVPGSEVMIIDNLNLGAPSR